MLSKREKNKLIRVLLWWGDVRHLKKSWRGDDRMGQKYRNRGLEGTTVQVYQRVNQLLDRKNHS